jgi:hypothetical protein
MSLEETSGDELSTLISGFENTPAEAQTSAGEAQPEPQASEATVSEPDPKDQEIELLRRAVAANPQMRHEYEMAKFGQSSLPQPPQYQQPQPVYQEPEPQPEPQNDWSLPFAPEEYDPADPRHQMQLVQSVVANQVTQALQPALEYIEHLKQQDAQEQQTQLYQQVNTMETEIHKQMDSFVPGFSDMYGQEQHTPEQQMVANYAYEVFGNTMKSMYPPTVQNGYGQAVNPLWGNPKVQAEVIKQIGPQVKAIASRLGLSQPTAQAPVNPQMAREAYVEPSNAVPSVNANAFETAAQHNDLLGMLSNF